MLTQKASLEFNFKQHYPQIAYPKNLGIKDLCLKYHAFPIKIINVNGRRKLLLVMADIKDLNAISEFQFASGFPIIPVEASRNDIQKLFEIFFEGRCPKSFETDERDSLELSYSTIEQVELYKK